MKVAYLIHILPTGEGSWDKIVRTLHISPFNPNRLGELKEDIERFRPVGSIVSVLYSIPSIKISFLTAMQKEEFMNTYISDSRIIANEKQIAFDDWRTKAKTMINKKFGREFDAPITHWKFTARTVSVESDDYTHNEGYAYIYGCDNYSGLVDVLKRRYPNCEIKYELSCSDDDRLVVDRLTISEANDFLRHVKPHENPLLNLVDIEFEERNEREECEPIGFRGGSIPNCVGKYDKVDSLLYNVPSMSPIPWEEPKVLSLTPAPFDYLHVDIEKEGFDMSKFTYKHGEKSGAKLNPEYRRIDLVSSYNGRRCYVGELPDIIRNVQFNEKKGVVTVIWIDGEVTMAKCGPNDIWDPEKGLAIAIMKRWFKSTTSMNKWIKGIIPEGCEAESLMDQLIHLYCQKDVEAVTEAVESYQAEMLEKYESVKEG